MRNVLIMFLALVLLTSAAWASGVNYLDTYRPLPYDVNPVERTLISYQTAKNLESNTSEFFNGNFLYAYLPYGAFDLRVESLINKHDSPVYRIGSLIKTDTASYQVAFESFAPQDMRMVHIDMMMDNRTFIWGFGMSYDINDALLYPVIKIGKIFKLESYDVDTKASYTDLKDGNSETDLTVRMIGKSIPAYIGLTLVSPPGSDLQKIIDLGVLINL